MRRRSSRGYGEWEEHKEREREQRENEEKFTPLRVNFRVLEVRGRVECVNGTHRFTDLNR